MENVGGACTLYIIRTHSVIRGGHGACWDCRRGQTNSFRLGEVAIRCVGVCWAVVRTCRRLVSPGRIYRVACNVVPSTSVCRGAECVRFPRCCARVCNTSVGRIGGLFDFRQCVLRPPFGKSRGTDKGKRTLSVQQKTEVLKRNGATTDI